MLERTGKEIRLEKTALRLAAGTLNITALIIPDIKGGTLSIEKAALRFNLIDILRKRYTCKCAAEKISFSIDESSLYLLLLNTFVFPARKISVGSLWVDIEWEGDVLWARNIKLDSENIKLAGFVKLENGRLEKYDIELCLKKSLLTDGARKFIKGYTIETGGWIEYKARK